MALLPQSDRGWLELPTVASGRLACPSQGAVVACCQPSRAWRDGGEVQPGMLGRKKQSLPAACVAAVLERRGST